MSKSPNQDAVQGKQDFASKMPDTYLILFFIALLAYLLTFVMTPGAFEVEETIQADGRKKVVIDPNSFQYDRTAELGTPLFAEGGKIGFLNLPFEGLVAGSKWGASIGVFAFILITGGAFGIIMATGSINRALLRLISRSQRWNLLAVPTIFFAFSLGGAVFGMGEEVIPFVLIITPIFLALGYDSLTTLLVTYVATQIGFACSWMNPFSVSVAQGIADLPLLSGSEFRIGLWAVFSAMGATFTTLYARSIKSNPNRSLTLTQDLRHHTIESTQENDSIKISLGDWLIISTLVAGISWMIWGVTTRAYYLPEIASQFFTMGLVTALIGIATRLDNMTANSAISAFREGASQLLPAALVVAFAKGIVLLLGGDGPTTPSILNSILHSMAQSLSGLPEAIAACAMYLFQSVFNFFVTSGSGQAALTMPIMAPLSDLLGVSRQVAVLAFQLGDGLTNILVPTSAALMGCLGAAKVEWTLWVRFMIKPMAALIVASLLAMVTSVFIELS